MCVLCVCVFCVSCVCVLSAHMPCKNPLKHGSQAKSILLPIATRHLTLAQADHVAGAKLGLVVEVVMVSVVVVESGIEWQERELLTVQYGVLSEALGGSSRRYRCYMPLCHLFGIF